MSFSKGGTCGDARWWSSPAGSWAGSKTGSGSASPRAKFRTCRGWTSIFGTGRGGMHANSDVRDIDAWLFDLDGVLTDTARVHAAAWKTTFDEFLARKANDGEEFQPFDPVEDYERYVDGKPRYDGVRDFLAS